MKYAYLLLPFFIISGFSQEKPADYKRLQERRKLKLEEIDEQYVEALERLKTKYTKKGNLEVALMINKEIKSFGEKNGKVQKSHKTILKNDLYKDLLDSKWLRRGNDITMNFGTGGKVTHQWFGKPKLHWENGYAVLAVNNNSVYIDVKTKKDGDIDLRYEVKSIGDKEILIKRVLGEGKDWHSGLYKLKK